MEILLVLVAVGLIAWAYTAFKTPANSTTDLTTLVPYKVEAPKVEEVVPSVEPTPPAQPAVDPVPVVQLAAVEAPVKKARRPRKPKVEATSKQKVTKGKKPAVVSTVAKKKSKKV
jgi:hypothetical protein